MTIDPLSTPSLGLNFQSASFKPRFVTVDSLAQLQHHLQDLELIDSQGKCDIHLESIPLPDACAQRIGDLLNQRLDFFNKSINFPAYLGTLTPISLLQNFWDLPIYLAGSSVWHVLGVEYIAAILEKFRIKLSPRAEAEIRALISYNDIDIKIDATSQPHKLTDAKNLIIQSLLPFLFQKRANNEEYANRSALLKDHTVEDKRYLASVGSRSGLQAEYNVFSKHLHDLPGSIFHHDGPMVSLQNFQVSSCAGSFLQTLLDFLFKLLRTNNLDIDPVAWARTQTYLFKGYKAINPELMAITTKNMVDLISKEATPEETAAHILSLLTKTVKNHLPQDPSSLIDILFIASYELRKHLSQDHFEMLWQTALQHPSLSLDKHPLKSIASSFADGTLPSLPFYHWLKLNNDPLVENFVPALTTDLLKSYCESPELLQKAQETSHLDKKVLDVLFQQLCKSHEVLVLWKKFEKNLSSLEKECYSLLLPAGVYEPIAALSYVNPSENSSLLKIIAFSAPEEVLVKTPPSNVLPQKEVKPVVGQAIAKKPKPSKTPELSPLVEPTSPVKKITKLEEPKEEVKIDSPKKAEKKASDPKTLFQMKGNEEDFQTLFDKACHDCLEAVEARHLVDSQIKQLLTFGKNKFNQLTSHDLFAKLLLVGLTLQNKISKENYKITFAKITSAETIIHLLHQLSLQNFPHDAVDFAKLLTDLPFSSEMDKKVRHLLKDRKGLVFQPNDVTIWFQKLMDSLTSVEIKAWIDLLLSQPKVLLAPLGKASDPLKEFVFLLFNLKEIPCSQIHKLKKYIFLDSERAQDFFVKYQARADKGSTFYAWETLAHVEQEEIWTQTFSSFDSEQAGKLILESVEQNQLCLPATLKVSDQHLQTFCDSLFTSATNLIMTDRQKFEPMAMPLLKFANKVGHLLICHTRFAKLFAEISEYKKNSAKEGLKLDLSKVSCAETKIQITARLDILGISYPLFDLSQLIHDLPYTPQNDENLRKHSLHLSKAPCSDASLIRWLEKVISKADAESLKKWLPLITSNLRSTFEKAPLLKRYGTLLLQDPTLDLDQVVKLKEMSTCNDQEDNLLYFDYLLASSHEYHIRALFELCQGLNVDDLWDNFFERVNARELLNFLPYFEGQSPALKQKLFVTLLNIDLLPEERLRYFKSLASLKASLKEHLVASLQWVNWLLRKPDEIFLEEAGKELLKFNTVSVLESWINAVLRLPKDTRKIFAPYVDVLFPLLPLLTEEKLLLIKEFDLAQRFRTYMVDTFAELSFELRASLVALCIEKEEEILQILKPTLEDDRLLDHVGASLYSKIILKWFLAYGEMVTNKPFTEEDQNPFQVETDKVIHLTNNKIEFLKTATFKLIYDLGFIDIQDRNSEKVCIKIIILLLTRLIDNGCHSKILRTLSTYFFTQLFALSQRHELERSDDWVPLIPPGLPVITHFSGLKTLKEQIHVCEFINEIIEEFLYNPDLNKDVFCFVSDFCFTLFKHQIPLRKHYEPKFDHLLELYLDFRNSKNDNLTLIPHQRNSQAILESLVDDEKKYLKNSDDSSEDLAYFNATLESYNTVLSDFDRSLVDLFKVFAEGDPVEGCYKATRELDNYFYYLINKPTLFCDCWNTVFKMFDKEPFGKFNNVHLHEVIYLVIIGKIINYAESPQMRPYILWIVRSFVSLLIRYPLHSSDDQRTITYTLLHTLVHNNEYTFYPQEFFNLVNAMTENPTFWLDLNKSSYPEKLEPISYLISLFSDKVRKPCENSIPLDLFQPQPLSLDEINKKTFFYANKWIKALKAISEKSPAEIDEVYILQAQQWLLLIKIHMLELRESMWDRNPEQQEKAKKLLSHV